MKQDKRGKKNKFDGKTLKKQVRPYILPVLLIAGLFAVILVTVTKQLGDIRQGIHEEMQIHLSNNAEVVADKLNGLYTSIESVAPLLADETSCTRADKLFAMNALRDACGFDFVVRTNINGIAMNYLGAENIDLSEREYIHEALSGQRSLSYITSGTYDSDNAYVVLAVPIMYDGRCVGALHGSYATKNFVSLLTEIGQSVHTGGDMLSVIAADGTIIATSDSEAATAVFVQMHDRTSNAEYAPDEAHLNIRERKKGFALYDVSGKQNFYYYQPLEGVNGCDWFLVSRLSEGYINQKTAPSVLGVLATLLIATAVATLLVVLTIKRQRLLAAQEHQTKLLSDALTEAESAGRAKSRFLSSVSHEMRTPLNAIIGFMALAKDAEPEQAKTYLANLELAAKQLILVINDVLDMSAIESGKLKLAEAPFDLSQIIHSITNIYVSQCQAKGIKFETKLLEQTDEWLVGDQFRLNQILMNLLNNAVKFTDKGRVQLLIGQMRNQDDKVFIRFEVTDTGCGMSQDMLARLFTPFEQEDATTARKYGGSGLGLSIVKNLVHMMGGAINVKSIQGEGSTFTVDLPFAKSEVYADLPKLRGIHELRVLAVDDDEVERNYISTVLKRIGVDFTCVCDGNAALAALEQGQNAKKPYNVCLIDWKMPNMDGSETTERIRAKYGKDVVVIVVSAYDHERIDEEAHKIGADLFIPKPLFQSSLFELFMMLAGGRVAKTPPVEVCYNFAGKRILLVEDNEMNRIVATAIINKLGVAHEVACDGQIAYDKFTSSAPGYYDAILMDVQMPNIDGLTATRMIRASSHPDAESIQIIALTANAFNEDVAKTLSAGMNAHVSKPIEMETLAAALDRAFRSKRG